MTAVSDGWRPWSVRRGIDLRDDSGFAGGVEVLPFGVLVFVIGTFLIMNLWAVIDAKMMVNTAAREAVHAAAEAPDGVTAEDSAGDAAQNAFKAFNNKAPTVPPWKVAFEVSPEFQRCAQVQVTITYIAPLVRLPLMGALGPSVPVTGRATSIVDPYRVGVPGESTC